MSKKNKKPAYRINIYLPAEVHKVLKAHAQVEGRTVSNLIRKYVLSGLVKRENSHV